MFSRHKLIRRLFAGLSLIAACFAATPRAEAVVSGDPMPAPSNGWVGAWNGSSCVAVGKHWFVSARHVGGQAGQYVVMKGVWYRALEVVQSTTYDVQLIRVAEDLPGYHKLAANPGLGDVCLLGGYGATAAGPLGNSAGYDWSGPRVETWGANVVESDGSMLGVRFDSPSAAEAVPHEAVFAVNDSGAGLFTVAPDGSLELAGIAVSVTSFGSSTWGCAAFALNVNLFRNWVQPMVDPEMPVSSAVVAPRAMFVVPGAPDWIGGAITLATLASLRRRRKE